jgi:uncharacterized repeat protein (TIGR01451 family)
MVRAESEPDSSYLGNGVFETSALAQSKSQPAFSGAPAAFRLLLKNAGDAADSFVLTGSGGGNGFSVRYLDEAGVDRVASLSGGGYSTAVLAPGQSLTLQLQVTPSALTLGTSYRVVVSAASQSDPGRIDQLKTETVVCGSAAAVTVSTPGDNVGFPGSVVNYPYVVTNVGSSINTFALAIASSSWPSAIYADDGAGGGIAGDGVRQSGETHESASTGPLAPGAAYRFFVAVSIPEKSADRARGDTSLTVTGDGASGADQITTSTIAAVITVADNVRNLTQGGPFGASGSAFPGDTLEYRMTITNSGSAPATSLGIDSTIPPNTSCLPGSLWIGTSANADGGSCEPAQCGWVRETAGSIVARLGQGATETAGGTLLPGKTLHVYFRVQVQ